MEICDLRKVQGEIELIYILIYMIVDMSLHLISKT